MLMWRPALLFLEMERKSLEILSSVLMAQRYFPQIVAVDCSYVLVCDSNQSA